MEPIMVHHVVGIKYIIQASGCKLYSDQYDWAICVLQSDVGKQLGWFGVQVLWL